MNRGAEPQTAAVSALGRLGDLLALLERAGAGPLRLEPRATSGDLAKGAVPFVLSGGADEPRRAAAEQILGRLEGSEREIESLCREVLDRYEEATLVYRLTERLGETLEEGPIARLVLEDAARVLGARSGEVWLRRHDVLRIVAAFPPSEAPPATLLDEAVESALRNGRPWSREACEAHEAVVAVPVPTPGAAPIGAVVLRGRSDGRSYRAGETKLLMALASRASPYIRNARRATEARRAEARRRQDEIARQVHRGLLPHRDPPFEGLDVAGGHRAAETVGGDYYGYVSLPDGSLGVAMADVSGHGVGAALYMAAAKGALQAEARRCLSPADLLRRTNEVLAGDFAESDVFATAFFARFHPGGRRMDCANAGHNPPLLLRAGGGVERLDWGGPALGVLSGVTYAEQSLALAPGDVLVVYTDGLVEARDGSRRFFGIDRLESVAEAARGAVAREIHERILADLGAHCGQSAPADDVTLVVVKAVAAPAAGEGRG